MWCRKPSCFNLQFDMKRICIVLMALLSMAVLSSFITMERKKEEKSLEALWAEYDKATQQDRVQKRALITEPILR